MESYRNALARYSTGEGFSVNVDVPENAYDVTSYQGKPLLTRMNMNPELTVDVRREADRISMQVENLQQIIKNIGYDEKVGKDFKDLKIQLEIMQHLATNYPIRYIKSGDLQKLYEMYEKNKPGIDKIIAKVVEQNKDSTGIHAFVGTAFRVRKGYPLYDQFGRKLTLPKEEQFLKDKIKSEKDGALNGFGDTIAPAQAVGPLLLLVLAYLYFKN
jgi:hypothetical protein